MVHNRVTTKIMAQVNNNVYITKLLRQCEDHQLFIIMHIKKINALKMVLLHFVKVVNENMSFFKMSKLGSNHGIFVVNLAASLLRGAVEALHVHVQVDDHLLAETAPWVRLQVQGVLVPFHVALARKHFPAHVAGKLAPLTLVYLRDVNAEIFGISEIFIADAAHKFSGGSGALLPRPPRLLAIC